MKGLIERPLQDLRAESAGTCSTPSLTLSLERTVSQEPSSSGLRFRQAHFCPCRFLPPGHSPCRAWRKATREAWGISLASSISYDAECASKRSTTSACSRLDNLDATGSTQETDTSAGQRAVRRDGNRGGEEQKAASTNRQQRQARRRKLRIDGSGGQAAQGRIQVRAEEPQQADAQGNPKNAPDDTRTETHCWSKHRAPKQTTYRNRRKPTRRRRDRKDDVTLEAHHPYRPNWA